MKRKFLTVYDYGSGGVWQYVLADNKGQIEEKYPQLTVLEELPEWWAERPVEVEREYDINEEPDEFMSKMCEPR